MQIFFGYQNALLQDMICLYHMKKAFHMMTCGLLKYVKMLKNIDTTRLHGGTEIVQKLKKAGNHKCYERIDTTDSGKEYH